MPTPWGPYSVPLQPRTTARSHIQRASAIGAWGQIGNAIAVAASTAAEATAAEAMAAAATAAPNDEQEGESESETEEDD